MAGPGVLGLAGRAPGLGPPGLGFGPLSAPLLALSVACPAVCTPIRTTRSLIQSTSTTKAHAVANIKSQIKRNKQNEKRHERNKSVKTGLKSAVQVPARPRTPATRTPRSRSAARRRRKLDKAASKGVIH